MELYGQESNFGTFAIFESLTLTFDLSRSKIYIEAVEGHLLFQVGLSRPLGGPTKRHGEWTDPQKHSATHCKTTPACR